jgi:hypothetical protein
VEVQLLTSQTSTLEGREWPKHEDAVFIELDAGGREETTGLDA